MDKEAEQDRQDDHADARRRTRRVEETATVLIETGVPGRYAIASIA